jgi:hypothetical protein
MKKVWPLCIVLFISLAIVADASAAGRLFRTNEPTSMIEELNPDTGALINSFAAPVPLSADGPIGCSGLAFANNRLFFENCGSSIYELNPSTGAVLTSFPNPSPDVDGLGFSGTELYVQEYIAVSGDRGDASPVASSYARVSVNSASPNQVGGAIYVLNPNTGALVRTLYPGIEIIGGLTYAGGRNTLFTANAATGMIYELNVSTGAVMNSFAAPVINIYGVGYSFSRETLFLGDNGSSPMTVYEVNPDTGAVINTLPVAPNWGLAADENVAAAAAVPTMNEWGMILFMALAGLGSVYYLRRKRRTVS